MRAKIGTHHISIMDCGYCNGFAM